MNKRFKDIKSDKDNNVKSLNQYLTGKLEQQNWSKLTSTIIEKIHNNKTTEAVLLLDILKDLKQGIHIHIDEENCNIIRDARNGTIKTDNTASAYVATILNYSEALKDLYEIEGKDPKIISNLVEEAKELSIKMLIDPIYYNLKDIELKYLTNEFLKKCIKKIEYSSITNATEKLKVARDFQNFKYPQYNFSTLTKIDNTTVIQNEIGMRYLSEEQIQMYKTPESYTWFKNITEFNQRIIKKYANSIMNCQHLVPTQLRFMPGLRNASISYTYVLENNKMIEINKSIHCSSIASSIEDYKSSIEIAESNINQLKLYNEKPFIISLVSPNNLYSKFDRQVLKQTSLQTQNNGMPYINLAFNFFRRLPGSNYTSGAKKVFYDFSYCLNQKIGHNNQANLSIINNYILNKHSIFEKICLYIATPFFLDRLVRKIFNNKNFSSALNATNSLYTDNYEIKKSVYLMLNAARDVKQISDSFIDKSIERSNYCLSATTSLNMGIYYAQKNGLSNYQTVTGCASGKDRTALALHDSSSKSIVDYFESKGQKMSISEIDQKLTESGHQTHKPGSVAYGGCSVGAYGTKRENLDAIPVSRFKNLKSMVTVTSQNNEINEPFIKSIKKFKNHQTKYLSKN